MSGERVVVDTSVLIDLAAGDPAMAEVLDQLEIFISIITAIEFLAWPKLTDAGLPIANALLEQYTTENIGRAIRDQAAFLKRNYRLKTPDAIIAATARHLNAPLLTRDKDFEKIADFLEVRKV